MYFLNQLILLSALASAVVAVISILKRSLPESRLFPLLAFAIFLYMTGYYYEINSTTVETAYLSIALEYLGMPFIPVLSVFFLADNYSLKIRPCVKALMLVPSFTACVLIQTLPSHNLYYRNIGYYPGPPVAQIRFEPGPLYYIIMGYFSCLLLGSLVLTIVNAVKATKEERLREYLIFIGILLPLAALLIQTVGLSPHGIDYVPVSMAVTLVIIFYATLRMNLLRMLPLAKEKMLEHMNDAFIVIDSSKRYLDANAAAKELFPALESLRCGNRLKGGELGESLSLTNVESGQEFALQREDGIRHYRVSCSEVSENGKGQCTFIILYDVTETKQLMEELHQLATYDNLTQVYNRGTFIKHAELEFGRAVGNNAQMAVMMIDLDHFKLINDTHGHLCGDMVLATVAGQLKNRLRQSDILGRYGGEEFAICLGNITSEDAIALAERLRSIVQEQVFQYQNSPPFTVTISIGVALFSSGDHKYLESLLSDADNALYHAKTNGRNQVAFTGPSHNQSCTLLKK